ncbi:MAG: glycosyltransferase family 4 protein [Candidatus Eremiobacteraeota bacterium]|nr:glycosyltransferase family 4 protein [Candidatus Eremiobacteraeota bacterium]MBC5828336.1 glycosyltransferase family 4 protein [Candidatus Eremiobacteraeota bacterium]
MDITLIVPEYPPHATGGGGVAYQSIARALCAQVESVRVLTGDHTGAAGSGTDGPIPVMRCGLMKTPPKAAYLNGYMPPRLASGWRHAVDSIPRGSVVHIHGIGLPFCDFTALTLQLRRRPYFLTNHGYPMRPATMATWARWGFARYEGTCVAQVVRHATKVSAISEYCSADGPLRQARVDVIPNGICEDILIEKLDPARSDYGSLLFVGRIHAMKGLPLAISAIASTPKFTLKVIGADGGELEAVQRLVRWAGVTKRVEFLGLLPRDGIIAAMRKAYAVVMPSLNEPFGMVGLEAMANGALLICSDTGGMRTYANDGNALLFKTGDAQDLARKLYQLPLDAVAYERLRSAALATARRSSWANVAQEYLNWYQS